MQTLVDAERTVGTLWRWVTGGNCGYYLMDPDDGSREDLYRLPKPQLHRST